MSKPILVAVVERIYKLRYGDGTVEEYRHTQLEKEAEENLTEKQALYALIHRERVGVTADHKRAEN